jgi:transposase
MRYVRDLNDTEWALSAPLTRPAERGGRPRGGNVHDVVDAIFHVLSTGCRLQ